jgi:hypothetical protein
MKSTEWSSPGNTATVGSPLFTDEPLQQYVTTIKGIHIGELRRAVDEVRRAAGQSPPAWSSYAPATGLVSFADLSTLRTILSSPAPPFEVRSAVMPVLRRRSTVRCWQYRYNPFGMR